MALGFGEAFEPAFFQKSVADTDGSCEQHSCFHRDEANPQLVLPEHGLCQQIPAKNSGKNGGYAEGWPHGNEKCGDQPDERKIQTPLRDTVEHTDRRTAQECFDGRGLNLHAREKRTALAEFVETKFRSRVQVPALGIALAHKHDFAFENGRIKSRAQDIDGGNFVRRGGRPISDEESIAARPVQRNLILPET